MLFRSPKIPQFCFRKVAVQITLAFFVLSLGVQAKDDADGWTQVSNSGGLQIYNRTRKDSPVKEFKAIGEIASSPATVVKVLEDTEEYPHFMPYVTETRVMSHTADQTVGYQRISPPIIGDRDYTVKVRTETTRCSEGVAYCRRWQIANELGPPERPGVSRIKANEGYWLLEPIQGGKATRATYSIYCDSGTSLPSTLLNIANRSTFPKLFDAVREQAKLQKYAAPAK